MIIWRDVRNKINRGKSIFLGFNIPNVLEQLISEVIPARWTCENIRYLGVKIGGDQDQIKDNIYSLTVSMQDKCKM